MLNPEYWPLMFVILFCTWVIERRLHRIGKEVYGLRLLYLQQMGQLEPGEVGEYMKTYE